ncbi:MAG: ABC transporter substrate-binding protein [Alphaproteobacteria bacterium]|jgi:putative tryptophan/tyrosine transport system substrate-binding protein|nr:ABC transporter substrate-binding protein [Alphaproteobacteria bacterium]MBT5390285.1 ABC transporter substrate-binding protein [Alphaproteobacteria bacterium]MBT5540442.1 ABC transporter substrate-binding protein [Alphaproteobacteria bacterium]MBT5654244.1 ABC transporter substrate-binding protein [Alphaproteobacteria bacterium]
MKTQLTLKQLFTFLTIFTLSAVLSIEGSLAKKVVAITQITQHPSLDKIRAGVLHELAAFEKETGEKVEIVYDNAQGNIALSAQIAQRFAGLNPDAIVAITTPSAQSVLSAVKETDIPLVFSAVTDPVGAKLLKRVDLSTSKVTGTIDFPPVDAQIALIKNLIPNLKNLGVIYNPGEVNSINQVKALDELATKMGITLQLAPADSSNKVRSVAESLVGKVEAIYIPNDNAVVSGLDGVLKVSYENKIPIFTSDGESVERGALAALANNQYEVGRDTGGLVVQLLSGQNVAQVAPIISNIPELTLNIKTAKKIHIAIPDGIIKKATKALE